MIVVPQWIEAKDRIFMVSLHMSAFRISKSEQVLIVKEWSKIMKGRREVLGGSNQKRSPQLGDRFIYILQYDEVGVLHMFYAILPEKSSKSD